MSERFELKAAQVSPGHLADTGHVSLVNTGPRSAYFVVSRFMLEKPVPAQPTEQDKK